MCEDGEKEYDEAKLATINFKLVTVEEEEDFTPAKLQEIQDTYQPEQIFIEYNGTWGWTSCLRQKCRRLGDCTVTGNRRFHDV